MRKSIKNSTQVYFNVIRYLLRKIICNPTFISIDPLLIHRTHVFPLSTFSIASFKINVYVYIPIVAFTLLIFL